MPFGLYEKLKAEAEKAGRSANAELVARLEQSLSAGSDDADIVMVFDILRRLSERNPHLRYSFSVAGGEDDGIESTTIISPAPRPRRKSLPKA